MSAEKSDRRLLTIGIIGTAIAALCCFTPVLVVLFGFVGLSAALGWAGLTTCCFPRSLSSSGLRFMRSGDASGT